MDQAEQGGLSESSGAWQHIPVSSVHGFHAFDIAAAKARQRGRLGSCAQRSWTTAMTWQDSLRSASFRDGYLTLGRASRWHLGAAFVLRTFHDCHLDHLVQSMVQFWCTRVRFAGIQTSFDGLENAWTDAGCIAHEMCILCAMRPDFQLRSNTCVHVCGVAILAASDGFTTQWLRLRICAQVSHGPPGRTRTCSSDLGGPRFIP